MHRVRARGQSSSGCPKLRRLLSNVLGKISQYVLIVLRVKRLTSRLFNQWNKDQADKGVAYMPFVDHVRDLENQEYCDQRYACYCDNQRNNRFSQRELGLCEIPMPIIILELVALIDVRIQAVVSLGLIEDVHEIGKEQDNRRGAADTKHVCPEIGGFGVVQESVGENSWDNETHYVIISS